MKGMEVCRCRVWTSVPALSIGFWDRRDWFSPALLANGGGMRLTLGGRGIFAQSNLFAPAHRFFWLRAAVVVVGAENAEIRRRTLPKSLGDDLDILAAL